MSPTVLTQAIQRRRSGLIWWALGIAGLAALIAIAYPTVRDNASLDKTFSQLSPGIQAALGLDPQTLITSPVGYLNSQYIANVLPVTLLVFTIGVAGWAVAGDEAQGTLELLLANPIGRVRVALERAGAMVIMLAGLTAASIVVLLLLAPGTKLTEGLPASHIAAANIASALAALTYASLTFAIGAATGNRGLAIGVSTSIAVIGFVVQGLAEQVKALHVVRDVMPWHWLIQGDPLRTGFGALAFILPFVVSAVLLVAGAWLFRKRDLA
jgi:beta-exotoxin I transport system permease protein